MLFPWFIRYPYVNDEILNLDWLTNEVKTQVEKMDTFINLNTIKYADPILWNITTQYETNTVVVDPVSGTAYISVQPVPSGIGLNNTDYWTVIFTMDIMSANKNITLRDDANNPLATFESDVDDWLLSQGNLYIVIRPIDIGEAYVVDYNIERRTVEEFLKEYILVLKNYTDELIGALADLTTTDKDNVVAAINELVASLGDVVTIIGDLEDLTTTDKDSIVNAINELVGLIGDLSTLDTTDKDSLVEAINEVVASIGDLSTLDTTDKTSLVEAINEVLATIDSKSVIVTPEMFGAQGDGVADDTNAFKAAINTGKVIYLSGTYNVAERLLPTNSIFGNGKAEVHATTNAGVFKVTTDGISFKDFIISGIADTSVEFGHAFYISGKNITISNVVMKNLSGDGIYIGGDYGLGDPGEGDVVNFRAENCEIYGVVRNGISVVHANQFTIEGCYIHDIDARSPSAGIDFESNLGVQITNGVVSNCFFKDCAGYGLDFALFAQDGTVDNTIDVHDCYIKNCGNKSGLSNSSPILIYELADVSTTRIRIHDVTIEGVNLNNFGMTVINNSTTSCDLSLDVKCVKGGASAVGGIWLRSGNTTASAISSYKINVEVDNSFPYAVYMARVQAGARGYNININGNAAYASSGLTVNIYFNELPNDITYWGVLDNSFNYVSYNHILSFNRTGVGQYTITLDASYTRVMPVVTPYKAGTVMSCTVSANVITITAQNTSGTAVDSGFSYAIKAMKM